MQCDGEGRCSGGSKAGTMTVTQYDDSMFEGSGQLTLWTSWSSSAGHCIHTHTQPSHTVST